MLLSLGNSSYLIYLVRWVYVLSELSANIRGSFTLIRSRNSNCIARLPKLLLSFLLANKKHEMGFSTFIHVVTRVSPQPRYWMPLLWTGVVYSFTDSVVVVFTGEGIVSQKKIKNRAGVSGWKTWIRFVPVRVLSWPTGFWNIWTLWKNNIIMLCQCWFVLLGSHYLQS